LTNTDENESQLSFPIPDQYHRVLNKYNGLVIHPDIIPFLDGRHHYDEICTQLECSPKELDEQLVLCDPDESDEKDALYEDADDRLNDGQPYWSVQFIFR
jgi:hypothetical protein